MLTVLSRTAVVALALMLGLFVSPFTGAAHAAVSPHTLTASTQGETRKDECVVLFVQLNGNSSTTQCLKYPASASKSALASIHPDTGTADCGNTLNLFEDAYQSGIELCFAGSGFANLTDYYFCTFLQLYCDPANDITTSWQSHSQSGRFYVDTNGRGTNTSFGSNSLGNFTSNPIPNDSLSSFCINNGCP